MLLSYRVTHPPTTSAARLVRASSRADRAHNTRALVAEYHLGREEEAIEAWVDFCDSEYDDDAPAAYESTPAEDAWPSFPSSIPMV